MELTPRMLLLTDLEMTPIVRTENLLEIFLQKTFFLMPPTLHYHYLY